jgi:HB1, ASXL, restriction endonuclease HTH domain
MDLSGHHSNPRAPLDALLDDASCDAGARREATEDRPTCARGTPRGAVGAAHPRQGRIIDAISQVLSEEGDPMQARYVHAHVESLLDEPVRWATVKATLAGNLDGPAPRFVRVARGRYGVPPRSPHSIDARRPTRPRRAPRSA